MGITMDDSILYQNGVYKVGADGKAQSGLIAGDKVVTGAGTYTINGVNSDGSYISTLTDPDTTTANYTGRYANVDDMVYSGTTTPTIKYDRRLGQMRAINAEFAAERAALEEQRKAVEAQASQRARQDYIDYMNNKKKQEGAAVRAGLSDSGAQEEIKAAAASGYGRALSGTLAEKTRGIADVELGLADTQARHAKAKLDAELDYANDRANSALSKQQKEREQKIADRDRALGLIAKGVISAETALAAGLTIDEAQAYYDAVSGKNMSDRSFYLTLAKNGVALTDEQLEKAGISRAQNQAWIDQAERR